MGAYRAFTDPKKPRRPFRLPPELDMGSLKLEDLEFDLEREVARLREVQPERPAVAPPLQTL